jgi:hypothetical protein
LAPTGGALAQADILADWLECWNSTTPRLCPNVFLGAQTVCSNNPTVYLICLHFCG